MKQTELLNRARVHLEEARKIRKIFKDTVREGNSTLPDGGMLSKGVLTMSNGKALFSTDQLELVCEHMFDKLPFVILKVQQTPVLT